ncbi:helix-turn-helix domain-containing protein [Ursidibacter sp. B-7004-1]
MSLLNSRLIIERMKSVLSANTDDELAQSLGKPSSTVRNWKTRNNLPFDTAVEFSETHSLSLDWLVSGKESEQLATDEQMVLLAYRQLTPAQKANLMMQMSGLSNGGNGSVVQNGDGGNNNQVFNGNVREVTGIRK